MSTDYKKINVDDISFEDLIDGGIQDSTEVEELELETNETEETDAKVEEEVAENDLDADAKEKEEEESIEAPVQKSRAKKETSKSIEEDAEETSEKEDDSIVSQVLSTLGYEVDDAYEDTTEGLVALTKDVGTQIADETLDKLFEQYPLVGKHLEYVMNGGQSENFMQAYDPNLDYNRIELAEDDSRSQKAILSDYFITKGHDKEFIKEMIEDYEDSGKLHNKAEAARQALGKVQAQQKEQMVAKQREALEVQHKEQQDFWNGVSETIQNSTEFEGLRVPEREKAKFFDWLSRPVQQNGYTQRDIAHANSSMETKLAVDYLMYKGFNLESIINSKAKTKAATSLRDKISRSEETVKSARKKSRVSKNVDLDNLDLNI